MTAIFSLAGKKALITGATGGIGGGIARAFHDAGAALAVSGSNGGKLAQFCEALRACAESPTTMDPALATRVAPQDPHPIPCDLSQLDTVEQLVKDAEEKLGGLDILVCNAAVTRDNLTLRMKDEEWRQVIDINLTASFRLARAAMRGMLKRRSGRMIFITSVVGWTGNPGQANYCASKAGLTGMSKSLAQEVAARGITINCIAPGFIATPMTDGLSPEQKERISQNIPLGRMGAPEDVAAGALYLASDAARYVTGQTLHVNGGLYMG